MTMNDLLGRYAMTSSYKHEDAPVPACVPGY
jgi:hypothetical protein